MPCGLPSAILISNIFKYLLKIAKECTGMEGKTGYLKIFRQPPAAARHCPTARQASFPPAAPKIQPAAMPAKAKGSHSSE